MHNIAACAQIDWRGFKSKDPKMDYVIQTGLIFMIAPRVVVIGLQFLSSTPVLWPIWAFVYLLLCTSYTILSLVLELLHLVGLHHLGLPELDINATMHTSMRIIGQFDCAIPGTEGFLLCDSPRQLNVITLSVGGIVGSIMFYYMSQLLFGEALKQQSEQAPVAEKKSD